jgi:hypothetical protein
MITTGTAWSIIMDAPQKFGLPRYADNAHCYERAREISDGKWPKYEVLINKIIHKL